MHPGVSFRIRVLLRVAVLTATTVTVVGDDSPRNFGPGLPGLPSRPSETSWDAEDDLLFDDILFPELAAPEEFFEGDGGDGTTAPPSPRPAIPAGLCQI